MYCVNCGTELEENCRFCHNCGAEAGKTALQQPASPVRTPVMQTASSGKKKFPILAVAILAVLAVAAALFLRPGKDNVNPAYQALLEQHGYKDYSILGGDTVAFLSDLGDGILVKQEFSYEGDLVTEHCMYMFQPLGDLKWNQQFMDQLKNETYPWDVVIQDDYYISIHHDENLDTEEGVRKYYALPDGEPVDLIEIDMIRRVYTSAEGNIPRELEE